MKDEVKTAAVNVVSIKLRQITRKHSCHVPSPP